MLSDKLSDGLPAFQVKVGNYIRDQLKGCRRIAYSEIGYASFVNIDREFIDTRGLTDATLAHEPVRYKSMFGFIDSGWRVPGSPLNRVLQQSRPDAIIEMSDFQPERMGESVLGDYRLVSELGVAQTLKPGERAALIYLRADGCNGVAASRPNKEK